MGLRFGCVGWLGIVIFVLFSLGLSLFFQFDPKRLKARPDATDLGQWIQLSVVEGNIVLERRRFVEPGRLFGRARLVEQLRHRDASSGEVTWVGPERVLERWFEV